MKDARFSSEVLHEVRTKRKNRAITARELREAVTLSSQLWHYEIVTSVEEIVAECMKTLGDIERFNRLARESGLPEL